MKAANQPPPIALPSNVKVLGWASLLNDAAGEMVFPLLPVFLTRVLGAGTLELGLLEGIADTVASLLKLWSGGRSDRAGGRRWFVIWGYVLGTLARPLAALATAPGHVVAARTVDRVGKGIRTAPRDAMIADSTPPEARGRAYGFHRAMDHVGAVVGPLAAAAFLWSRPDDLRTLFLLTAVPGVAVVIVLLFGLREPRKQTPAKATPRLTLRPLDARFRWFLVALAIFTFGNTSDLFLLHRAGDLGLAPFWLPLVWAAFHIVKAVGNVWAGRAVDRFGPRRLILAGWLVFAVFYTAFAYVDAIWQFLAAFAGYGVFYALTEPAEKALVASLAPAENRGLAFGWYNLAIGLTALPGNVLFGWVYGRFGAQAAFGYGAALAAVAAVVIVTLVRPASSERERA